MEKDIGKIKKNDNTDIVVRIDDFGGRIALTIREFVNSSDSGYSGFTKAGTRIPASEFKNFKELINNIDEKDLEATESDAKQKELSEEEEPEIKEETI